jgi:CheY-like chemotaxis protein
MPGMSGLDAFPLLREKQANAKIGLFTANIQKSIQERCKEEGAIFVEKPITEERVANFFS